MSANPLKGTGHMTQHGIVWFAERVFGTGELKKEARHDFSSPLDEIIASAEKGYAEAPALAGIDMNDPANHERAFEILKQDVHSIEWFNAMIAALAATARDAIQRGDANEAAWAMSGAERFRALAVFKSCFEEAVFVGQSVRRLIDLIRLWDSNKTNKEEGFWQHHLKENSTALSQAFSVPVTFIQDNAYLGGMKLDRKDARLLDFLLAGGSGKNAILVEIKTPVTPLLGRPYRRSAIGPSKDLTGAVAQVLDYRHTLQTNWETITRDKHASLGTFHPKCMVIAGNYAKEIVDENQKRAFELFRNAQRDVEIVTFDEFFLKIELLAKLFNVIRTEPASNPAGDANAQ